MTKALAQARGRWQVEQVRLMLDGGCPSYARQLRGRAKRYEGRYRESFTHLLARLRDAGVEVKRIPGPRGGEWGATYQIVTGR